MFDLKATQSALNEFGIDAWLLYDFRGNNPLARNVLGIDAGAHTTRRFFYLVPASGEPRKLVHAIETGTLDHVPVGAITSCRWSWRPAFSSTCWGTVGRDGVFALNANPADLRGCRATSRPGSSGVEAIPRATLIARPGRCPGDDEDQWAMHLEADRRRVGL